MVFCHPVAIERLVRTYASEYADSIDFSTLEKLDAELVGESLVRRYPDMLWMARTAEDEGRVVIQLEFQGARDRLMALRMAVYQLLTVQQLFRRRPSLRGGRPLEMLSFVIYHGQGSGKASTSLRQLFPRWVPGNYRVVSRAAGDFEGDLAQTILKLERDHSVEGTLAAMAALTRIADETGTDYDRLMAECVGEMLVSCPGNFSAIRAPIHPRWSAALAESRGHIYSTIRHVFITFSASGLRSALLFGRIAVLFASQSALPARQST